MVEPAMGVEPAALNSANNPTLSAAPKDRRQYTCLCGSMHLRTATLVIGALETIALVIGFLSVVVRYAQGRPILASLIGVIVSVIIFAAALVCLFTAVRRQFPPLLLPHIVVQALATVGFLIYAVVLSAFTIGVALRKDLSSDLSTSIGILVVVLLATGVNTWFTVVVAKYYHFLRGHL